MIQILVGLSIGYPSYLSYRYHFSSLPSEIFKYENLNKEGQTTVATLQPKYRKQQIRSASSYSLEYTFRVDTKTYRGTHHSIGTFNSLNSDRITITYVKNTPSINSSKNIKSEYTRLQKKLRTKEDLVLGSVFAMVCLLFLRSGIKKIIRVQKTPRETKEPVSQGITSVDIQGFDPAGEPELRCNQQGTLEIHFNFMPPLESSGEPSALEIFDSFDEQLSAVLKKTVIWEDREVFLVENATEKDMYLIKNYLENFWNHDY